MKVLPLLPLLCVLAPLTAQDKHTLRYTFTKGHTAFYHARQTMDVDINMGGQGMKQNMELEMWTEHTISDVKDGTATLELKFRRITGKTGGMGGSTSFDSNDKAAGAGPFAGMNEIIGQTATARVDARGAVTDVTLPEKGGKSFERAGIDVSQLLGQMFPSLPEAPVAVGEKWNSESTMPMGEMGDAKVQATNTLKEAQKEAFTIESALTFQFGDGPKGMKMSAPKATSSAKLLKSALPLESTLDATMEMKMGEQTVSTILVKLTSKQIPALPAEATGTGKPTEGEKTEKSDKPAGK